MLLQSSELITNYKKPSLKFKAGPVLSVPPKLIKNNGSIDLLGLTVNALDSGQVCFVYDKDDIFSTSMSRHMEDKGFLCNAIRCHQKFRNTIASSHHDIVILNLRTFNRFNEEFIRDVRSLTHKPVVTVLMGQPLPDHVQTLTQIGADVIINHIDIPSTVDMVINIQRLAERVKRGNISISKNLGNANFNSTTKSILKDGKIISLTQNEREIMTCLMKNFGNCVPRDSLLMLWPEETESALELSIHKLRKKLKIHDIAAVIRTFHGNGYGIHLERRTAPRPEETPENPLVNQPFFVI